MSLVAPDVPVPSFLYSRFPDYKFCIAHYEIPSPFYAHRRTLLVEYGDNEWTDVHVSKHLLMDCEELKNKALQDWLAKRVTHAVKHAQAVS